MSDRMPEDLPVTKCINVMVGITRSKVIFGVPISMNGVPPNGWFIMENEILKWMIWGYPYFRKPSYVYIK